MRQLLGRARLTTAIAALVLVPTLAGAQATRAEEIDQARRDKSARLWPDRESPLVAEANNLVERGLGEGTGDGRGVSGPRPVLGGMRSGHGVSFGGGYRKTDFWSERLGAGATGRMTVRGAYMVDGRLDFHSLAGRRGYANLYAKYEHSPRMDFYGLGPFSKTEDRSSFLLEDLSLDFQMGLSVGEHVRIGVTGGAVLVKTGEGRRPGVPSTDAAFTPEQAPGIGEGNLTFERWGGFLVYDSRDSRSGSRSGTLLGTRFRGYGDRTLNTYNFRQAEFEFQQYLPYFNGTRVVALRLATVLSFNDDTEYVPVYFMPTVGGNDDLRGFPSYRFHDNHAVFLSAEHRWYVMRSLDMATFIDAGKVIPLKADLNFSDIEVSAGVGWRFRLRDSIIMRTDLAWGNDGFRVAWTFSDIFKVDY